VLKKCSLWIPLLLTGCGPLLVGGVGTVGMSAVEERGFGGVVSDQSLWVRLNYELADISGLEITVYNGRVLLTGVVVDERAKRDAVRLAKGVSGVNEVIDGTNLRGEAGFGEYTRDSWITTKLKANLYADEDVIAPNYLVKTFDKVVYIFGTAYTQEEMDRVVEHAYDITGVRKVVNLIELYKPEEQGPPPPPPSPLFDV